MENQESIEQCMSIFKKYLHISSFYAQGHPLFVKAAGDFKNELDPLLFFLKRLRIGIASSFLLVGETKYNKPQFQELAKRLHVRRIKAVELSNGITSMELGVLLNISSVPAKDLRQQGGLARFFRKEEMGHLVIEELDYSDLLKANTGEYKYIWMYLLSDSVENKDETQVNDLSESFGKMMGYFSLKEFLENNELKENLQRFFDHLREHDSRRFTSCLGEMTKHISRSGTGISSPDLAKIKEFFDRFKPEDIAQVLVDEISNTEEFDAMSFEIFSKVVDPQKHAQVASYVAQKIGAPSIDNKQRIINRLQKLFSVFDTSSVSDIYRNTLASYLKNISFEKIFAFDREHARTNYRMILLNLCVQEQNDDRLKEIIAAVRESFQPGSKGLDFLYVTRLVDGIKHKKTQSPQAAALFSGLEKDIAVFVENGIWDEGFPPELGYLADALQSSALGLETYLHKIFTDRRVSALILKLFLRFFSGSLSLFYSRLDTAYADIEFVERVMRGLRAVDGPQALEVLEHVYRFSGAYLKVEAIRAMRDMKVFDKSFLLSVLREGGAFLKQEALLSLSREETARRAAFEELFFMKNPWGTKNKIIMENISVVEGLDLRAAREYLVFLTKKFSLWDWDVKRKAGKVLRLWNS
ncbi:MAG: hypothetical protein WC335_00455 [Candidatus Omnitrophota bacterium]|jgi:Ca2+-binding EF-hand superfamily protein